MLNFNYPIIIVDTETGGLNPNFEIAWEVGGAKPGDKITGTVLNVAPPVLEIGAIALNPKTLKEEAEFHAICGPEPETTVDQLLSRCHARALDVNGFREKKTELAKASPLSRELQNLASWLSKQGKHVLAGQNVRYDILMINAAARRAKVSLELARYGGQILELQTLSVLHFGLLGTPLKSYKLTSVAEALEVQTEGAHSAMADVRMVAECLRRILKKLERKD
jgi:DNA polymerase III epsilon subunit-like protein